MNVHQFIRVVKQNDGQRYVIMLTRLKSKRISAKNNHVTQDGSIAKNDDGVDYINLVENTLMVILICSFVVECFFFIGQIADEYDGFCRLT